MTPVRLSDALNAVALAPTGPLGVALDTYYAPDYVHRSDGRAMDRAAFMKMAVETRGQIRSGTVRVLDELRDGDIYAERHVYTITMHDGATVEREIAVFGRYAPDGRFRELSETGFTVAETPAVGADA